MKPDATTVAEMQRAFAERARRQEMPTYVYTYPPKGAYRPFSDGRRVADSWRGVTGPVNLYLHVPFCLMKCSFCSLCATTEHSPAALQCHVDALQKELDLVTACVPEGSLEVASVYIGGGTPTVLSADQLVGLLAQIRSRFGFHPEAEIGIEAAPNSVDEPKCRALRDAGFNRISLGIQSFDDRELRAMGRRYGADLGRRMVETAIEAGFPNVNVDLIYGLPGQTTDSWMRNLEIAAHLGPPTLTLYPLVVRSATAYGRQYRTSAIRFPDDSLKYLWQDLAVDFLESMGYAQRTLVTYTRDGGGCQHEANEFADVPTIGLGPGARSYAPRLHYASDDYLNPQPVSTIIETYLRRVGSNEIPVLSAAALDEDTVIRRCVILRLLAMGVDREAYLRRFGEPIEQRFGAELEVLDREGCLDGDSQTVKLCKRGRRLSSLVADLLTSTALKEQWAGYR